MRQLEVNQTGNDALSRMSIYDMMVLDVLGCAAALGLAVLLGVISVGKGLGGVVLCGATAAGVLAYRHLTADTSEPDPSVDRPERSPPELIAGLQAALESNPGDVSLSGMIVAFQLACELGESPPESQEAMLQRLSYGRLALEYGCDICIEPEDVLNARRYYIALSRLKEASPTPKPRRFTAFTATGMVAERPELRDGVAGFPLDVTALQLVGDQLVDVTTRYDVRVSSEVADADLEQIDVGSEITIRGSVEIGTQQLKIGGEPLFSDDKHGEPVMFRPLQLFAAEMKVRW